MSTSIAAQTAAQTAAPSPIGYAVGVVVTAICVGLALVAPRWRGLAGAVSYRVGLAYNELPFLAFYLLLASTVLTFNDGVRTPVGWVALAGALAVTIGLAVVVRRAARARSVVRHALDAGLGTGWRASLDAGLAQGLRRRPPYARILLFPFALRPLNVVRVRNRRYGDAGRRNLLDVYHRRDRPRGAPVMVYLHGGGYYSGRKNWEAAPLRHRLAAQGWVCISANYRLRPAASFPDHLIDAKKVIAWARAHAAEYGGDPDTLVVAGSSAGGHLATLCALTPGDPALQPGFEAADTSVAAAVSLYGYYGRYYGRDATEPIASTPSAYPAADAPPLFIAHGDHDTLVPVADARLLATRLRSLSPNPVVYAELVGGQHAFDLFHSLRFAAVIDGVEAFTAWVRSRADLR